RRCDWWWKSGLLGSLRALVEKNFHFHLEGAARSDYLRRRPSRAGRRSQRSVMARPPVRSRRVHVVVLTLLGLLSSSPAIAQGEVSAPRLARWVDADLPPEVSLGARGLRAGLHLAGAPTGGAGGARGVGRLGPRLDRAAGATGWT